MSEKMEDIVLFTIGYLGSHDQQTLVGKENLSKVLALNSEALNRYLRALSRSGRIDRVRIPPDMDGYSLSDKGKDRYEDVSNVIMDGYLTPQQHSVQKVVHIKPFLKYIKNPILSAKLVTHTYIGEQFDVSKLFQEDHVFREGARILSQIDEVLNIKEDGTPLTVEDTILSLTSIGLIPGKNRSQTIECDRIRSTLANIEYLRRCGRHDDSLYLSKQVLESIPGLEPNVWIIAYTRFLKCLMGKGEHQKVHTIIDRIDPFINNSVYRAMILEVKADSLSLLGEYDESERLFKYCLGVFHAKNLPIMTIIVWNNLGVLYFRRYRNDMAEDCWNKSIKIARKKGLPWAQAVVKMNLGDHLAHNKGETKRGMKMVREARKIMNDIDDMEGVADSYFNSALILVEMDNIPLAVKHFTRSLEYPIHDPKRREERIAVFNGRLEKSGKIISVSFK